MTSDDIQSECTSLVEILRWRAQHQPDQRAYTFLADGEAEAAHVTHAELDARARAIGARLQRMQLGGECVLLLYPPGLEFVAAFFGCLYAGAIAVPTHPPRLNRSDPRLQAIVRDTRAQSALTTAQTVSKLDQWLVHNPGLKALRFVATDAVAGEGAQAWRDPGARSDALAYLQYTSGSTATPRGVMVSHGNLLHNLSDIRRAVDLRPDSASVTWLPHWHDMGLVSGILASLYAGIPSYAMAPGAFVQRPFRWLKAISRYGATHSGAPNFAYDLCVRKVAAAQHDGLDLRAWNWAYVSAEPVRRETIERFARTFEPCGFRAASVYPCYGLAEATLMATGGRATDSILHTKPDDPLTRTLVGCGRPNLGTRIAIVHPETSIPCAPLDVGEIWISGPTVAQGYWLQPEETEGTFRGTLADTGEGPFLRTGDLGFMSGGELFVTGRIKDLIIIRGRNYYPQDIERSVEESHTLLQPGCGAAFTIDMAGEQRLVVAQEVRRQFSDSDTTQVARCIRQAVAEEHGLQVNTVVLIKPAKLPKTTSGKVQRHLCRERFLTGSLEAVAESSLDELSPPADHFCDTNLAGDNIARRVAHIVNQLARGTPSTAPLRPDSSFQADLGMDSLRIVELAVAIEREFGIRLDEEYVPALQTVGDLIEVVREIVEVTQAGSRGLGSARLAELSEAALEQIPQLRANVTRQDGRKLLIEGRWIYDFASLNYLGLDLHPEVMQAIPAALEKWGVHPSWSRIVASPQIFEDLEERLADLVGAPTVLLFPAVTLLHMGVLPLLAGNRGVILMDGAAHHSIYEASQLAQAGGSEVLLFNHADTDDLARKLEQQPAERAKIIAIDGVYSMSGEYPDIPTYVRLAKKYAATVYIDDAHGLGIVGERPDEETPYGYGGGGIVKYFGLNYTEDPIVYVGGLSKSFSSFGAFVTCADQRMKRRFSTASTFVFSGPSPVASLASALAGLAINQREGDRLRGHVYGLTRKLVMGARALGFEVDNHACFPIVSVVIGKTKQLIQACQVLWEHGILITPALFPAVPMNRAVLRFSITAANTAAEVDQAIKALEAAASLVQEEKSV